MALAPRALAAATGPPLRVARLPLSLWRFRGEPGQLIPLLQAAQEGYGYVPELAIRYISGVTGVAESEVYGVITFYRQFRLRPVGRWLVRLCDGTACHVSDARALRQVIERELALESSDTTDDGLFTLQTVACLGCCSLAPVMMVNDEVYGRLTPQGTRRILKNLRRAAEQPRASR